MREAIITVVEPATDSEPAHTKVFRVEFEGDFGITTQPDSDSFEFSHVANSEQLVGHREVPGVTGR